MDVVQKVVFLMNVVVVTLGKETDDHAQQGAADGVCLLRSEPLWLFTRERPGGDLVHTGTASLSCSGENTSTRSFWFCDSYPVRPSFSLCFKTRTVSLTAQ